MVNKKQIIKEYKRKQKLLYKKSPEYQLKKSIVRNFNDDYFWSFPFISKSEHISTQVITKNLSDFCNQERISSIKLSRNSHYHKSDRSILEPYFNIRKPIFWQAIISDAARPKPKSHNGFLLLDHVIIQKFDSDNFSLGFCKSNNQIDFHLWLSIDQIKYFGRLNSRELAVGDVITGQSFVERYKNKNNEVSFGLGKTIIEHCGIPIVDNYYVRDNEIKATKAMIADDYDRKGDWIVKLTYPEFYKTVLNRYKKISIKTLQFLKGNIFSYYKSSKYTRFYDLGKAYNELKNYDELSNLILSK